MVNRVCRFGVVLWFLGAGVPVVGSVSNSTPPIVLTLAPVRPQIDGGASVPGEAFADAWFGGAQVVVVSSSGQVRRLANGFSAACDPEVSFDGRRVLFAGKKGSHSPWSIWETSIDGGKCRAVCVAARDCRHPVFLSSLFTLDSPGPWFTVLFVGGAGTLGEAGSALFSSLYSVKLDGTELRRITFNPQGDLDPAQAADGRVIYAAMRGRVGPQAGGIGSARCEPGRRSLFTVNIDGTAAELYGAEGAKPFQRMPCATAGGLVVFVEADTPDFAGGGELGLIEERRPHHSYRRVPADPHFGYAFASPLAGNSVLVSRRTREGEGRWEVSALDLESGRAEVLFATNTFHAVQARVARPRPSPDGRSTVVNLSASAGTLYALNLYETDPRLAPGLAPGSVRRVRVIEGVPAPPTRGSVEPSVKPAFGRRLLGEAPVEPDGSLQVLVPADIPLEIQALDTNGLAVATCRWLWVKQKENRGCIGCHEDHELVPENLYALAVQRPATQLTPPPEQRRGIGFRDNILPLLQLHCAAKDCHGGAHRPLLGATTDVGAERAAHDLYRALGAPGGASAGPAASRRGSYVEPGCARTSVLIGWLLRRDSLPPGVRERCPATVAQESQTPAPARQTGILARAEFQLLAAWIDLGAPWEAPPRAASTTGTKPPKPAPTAPVDEDGM